jgi:hypothetical protein
MFRYRDKYLKKEDELLELADKDNFFKKRPIMLFEERKLFNVLMKLYNENYFVFPQVTLTSLLEITEGNKDHENIYHSLGKKSVDFAIFDKTTISPILAIELNGKSHSHYYRINRDEKVKHILTKSGIPLITIPVSETYDEMKLKQLIDPLLVPTT